MAGTILAQGILSPRTFLPTSWPHAWYLLRALRKNPRFVFDGLRLRKVLMAHGVAPEKSLRFVTSDKRVTSGLFGTSNADHVRANAKAASQGIDPALWQSLVRALEN